jgi:hypothetical protein
MYFAKFFHKSGGDDRLLLYTPNVLMGIYARDTDYGAHAVGGADGNLPGEFLRREFGSMRDGIGAYRRETERLCRAGYIETHHTDYTLRDLRGDTTAKPEWQRALDEALLALFADPLQVQAQRIAALEDTLAESEPVTLWARAHHAAASRSPHALAFCEEALSVLRHRKSANIGFYTWSLRPRSVEAYILELLSRLCLAARAPTAALEAIEQAMDAELDCARSLQYAEILCDYFPGREEDAFDSIYRDVEFGDYSTITSRSAYKRYAARRAADASANRASWRWSAGRAAADEASIDEAERQIGARLPESYRAFLRDRGKSVLFMRGPREDAKLLFHAPGQLARQRDNLLAFLGIVMSPDDAASVFYDKYAVSLRHLIPVAAPENASNALLLHTGPGEAFGRVYVWNHDEPFELAYEQDDFGAMLKVLLDDIIAQDAMALDLFNIYPAPQ